MATSMSIKLTLYIIYIFFYTTRTEYIARTAVRSDAIQQMFKLFNV